MSYEGFVFSGGWDRETIYLQLACISPPHHKNHCLKPSRYSRGVFPVNFVKLL